MEYDGPRELLLDWSMMEGAVPLVTGLLCAGIISESSVIGTSTPRTVVNVL